MKPTELDPSPVAPPNSRSRFAGAFWPANPSLATCSIPVLAGLAAMALRAILQPLLGDALPFVLAFPAVVWVALRYGAAASALTALTCAAWALASLVPPFVAVENMPLQLGAFMLSATVIGLICAGYRRPHTSDAAAAANPAVSGEESVLERWLRAVLWGAALLPLTAFVAAAGWGYQDAFRQARELGMEQAHVASRHAKLTFDAALETLGRAEKMTQGPTSALDGRESELHERMRDLVVAMPGAGLFMVDAQARPMVSSALYPIDRTRSVADRDYFKQAQQQPLAPLHISEVFVGRQTGLARFTVSRARVTPQGAFDGVIGVTLSPEYFQEFYKTLAPAGTNNTFVLYRDDGAILTRWPSPPRATPRLPSGDPLLVQMQEGAASGVMLITSLFDGERRLLNFVRVPELPLYAQAGLAERNILADWYRFLQWLAAILVPTTLVLVGVTWVALQRVRAQQAVLAALQAETARRAQAEGALLHAQKLEALGQLTGGVAHDFNNLLGIVSNNAYLLKRIAKDEAAAGPLAAIGRATASGVKLTRQLLSFARKHALKPETLRLQEWLPACADLLRTTLGSRTVLTIEVDADTAPVRVDPSELELALINLAVNAKHAMVEAGRVHIHAGPLAAPMPGEPLPGVQIRFTDSGSGIPPEAIGRVFEPFFTTKAPGVGSGLGLSQVYGLCVQAGGTARVESTVGQGTTVSLLFPAQSPSAAEAVEPGTAAPTRLHGCVLLVEDNDDLAAAQEQLLRSVGLDVLRVSRADRAEQQAQSATIPFDVVLSDVMMPGPFDGIELAFRLRKSRPQLPVILLTGYAHQIEKAAEAGFVVLGKPVEPARLFAELAKALQNKR